MLKKCKKPDDVLFINAAEGYDNGKRQNLLLPEHIAEIGIAISTAASAIDDQSRAQRHGVSKITDGHRHTLGIIFHDAS